jgi:hypothetical protein
MQRLHSQKSVRNFFHRAKFVLQKDEIDRLLDKLDKALGDLKDCAADIFGQ